MRIGGTTKSGLPSAATLVYEIEWARLQDTGASLIQAPDVESAWQSRCALRVQPPNKRLQLAAPACQGRIPFVTNYSRRRS